MPIRDTPFGYVCHRCGRCCHEKRVRLNPYEMARLANNCGASTSEFQARATVNLDGVGVALRQEGAEARCVLLGPEGCLAYPDRPLACRLYPLGRQVTVDGDEIWVHVQPDPKTKGDYTITGVIGDYVGDPETERYIRAADQYSRWVRAAVEQLASEAGPRHISPADDLAELTDPDTAIASHCARTGDAEPTDTDKRKDLHLRILWRTLGVEHGEWGDEREHPRRRS